MDIENTIQEAKKLIENYDKNTFNCYSKLVDLVKVTKKFIEYYEKIIDDDWK